MIFIKLKYSTYFFFDFLADEISWQTNFSAHAFEIDNLNQPFAQQDNSLIIGIVNISLKFENG
jgi:hypothetical protein